MGKSVSLPSDKTLSSQLIPCFRHSLLQSIRSCHFWHGQFLCQQYTLDLPILLCLSEQCVKYLSYFCSLVLLTSLLQVQLLGLSQLHQSLFPCKILFLIWLSVSMELSSYWAFYVLGSGLPLSCSRTWEGFNSKVHIAIKTAGHCANGT